MPLNAIFVSGRPAVVIQPIEADSFNTLPEFKQLANAQVLHTTIVTQEAWDKLENLLGDKKR